MPMQRLIIPRIFLSGLLALCLAAAAPGAAAVEGDACENEPTDQRIGYGDLISCAIDQIGDSDSFRFSGGSGDTVKIQVSRLSGGIACFQLFDPSGESLDFTRCANTSRDYLLSQTGVHTIVILKSSLDETAQYALALERVDPPSPAALPIDYNEVINNEINAVGDVDLFFFSAEAGDAVKVQLSRLSGGIPCFQLYAPDGRSIDFARCANTSRDYPLAQGGTHAIAVLESSLDQTAQYALTLACVSGVCPDVDLPAVSGCIARRGAPLDGRRVRLLQSDEPTRTTLTDVRGCYEFRRVVAGKRFQVRITSPRRAQ